MAQVCPHVQVMHHRKRIAVQQVLQPPGPALAFRVLWKRVTAYFLHVYHALLGCPVDLHHISPSFVLFGVQQRSSDVLLGPLRASSDNLQDLVYAKTVMLLCKLPSFLELDNAAGSWRGPEIEVWDQLQTILVTVV